MSRNKRVTLLLVVLAVSTYFIFWGVENEFVSQEFAVIALPVMLAVTTAIIIWNASRRK